MQLVKLNLHQQNLLLNKDISGVNDGFLSLKTPTVLAPIFGALVLKRTPFASARLVSLCASC